MKLSELAEEKTWELHGDAEISGLCTDSRAAGEGDLFFCIRGTHTDAHAFAVDAERRGACAIVCEERTETALPYLLVPDARDALARIAAAFFGHPERKLTLIGVTGTNGKTTVCHMLYRIFLSAGKKAGVIGTLGTRYGEISLPPSLTTPDPVNLFSLLSDMVRANVAVAIMEVSAHALALRKVPIVFDAAVFTNLTQDHLDFFPDMHAYGEAKKKLFSPAHCRLAVLNSDEAFFAELAREGAPAVSYGLESPADCFALVEHMDADGCTALLNLEDELVEVRLRLIGRHNVYNALAAAAAARRLGVGAGDIARGLNETTVEGRLERVGSYRGAALFVDFAHTPDGLFRSLEALREHCEGELFLVFGCGGDRDRAKRPIMGEIAAKGCDFAVITSDNPRYEEPCAIISEIEAGFSPISKRYVAIEERERAISYALGLLHAGDVLLVAGKGGETTQEIMGIKYRFNDKDILQRLAGKHDA